MIKSKDIICFAGEDWWYHNPHSNLHLMKAFAVYNRVLFVNSIGIRMPNFKQDKFALKRIVNKFLSLIRYFRKGERNIYVLTPFALPVLRICKKQVQFINKYLLVSQLKVILLFLSFKNPIIWAAIPTVKDVALYLKRNMKSGLIYYCVDNYSYYEGEENSYIKNLENNLIINSNLVLFVNERLGKEKVKLNPNTFYISHGVDFMHFSLGGNVPKECLAEIDNIKRPIVEYIGALKGLDFDLVKFLAQNNKDISFVFIGEVLSDIQELKYLPNVFFLGKKSYAVLPEYMDRASCLAIYYKEDNEFNKYRNPKKLLEYLSTGRPVVSTANPELLKYKDSIYIASSYSEFDILLKKAIYEDNTSLANQRINLAKNRTWDSLANEISNYIIRFCC